MAIGAFPNLVSEVVTVISSLQMGGPGSKGAGLDLLPYWPLTLAQVSRNETTRLKSNCPSWARVSMQK